MTPQPLHGGYGYGHTPETPLMMNRPLNVADNATYEHRQQPHIGGEQGPPTTVMRTISDRPHERFFLMDGSIEFRVHDVLFKVHLHFFSRAKVFRILGPYLPPVIDLNGFGLKPSEFELLLTIFYPRTFGTFEIQDVEGWASVLKVVSALGLDDIRTLAIEKLLEISSPVDIIMLAETVSFIDSQMLVLAFKELCMRPEPLTEEEGRKLGTEFLNKLARMKHELQHNTAQYLDSDKVDRMLCRLVET
ncbi:hypothetical protein DFH05DRAFT_560539 [Lentinula detonsa]|uniref:BTB domain-containing protein n=1 Tax=Lentinula detonsa TaxID=2804962 RepID=A0A9W8U0W0_9AGAR|nr:hypothetical protein DFH05DRAFT_560539 [Lentinula detonsa]